MRLIAVTSAVTIGSRTFSSGDRLIVGDVEFDYLRSGGTLFSSGTLSDRGVPTQADLQNTSIVKMASAAAEMAGTTWVPGGTVLGPATETVAGLVMLATSAETVTGTNTSDATHPAGVKAAIDSAIDAIEGGVAELYDETVPASPAPTYLLFDRDVDGDVQQVILGTAT